MNAPLVPPQLADSLRKKINAPYLNMHIFFESLGYFTQDFKLGKAKNIRLDVYNKINSSLQGIADICKNILNAPNVKKGEMFIKLLINLRIIKEFVLLKDDFSIQDIKRLKYNIKNISLEEYHKIEKIVHKVYLELTTP